jgi:predicted DNA-binding ribbon-helix-helix protein
MAHAQTRITRMNIIVEGRRTSLALEAGIWDSLTEMCRQQQKSLDETCEDIVREADGVSMASAIRTAVLKHFMARAAA